MIHFTIYAIGRVGDAFKEDHKPGVVAAYRAHERAEWECRPLLCARDIPDALRTTDLTVHHSRRLDSNGVGVWGVAWPFDARTRSSVDAGFADLSARLVHLADHPDASLIFVEHEGYRFLDPVDEMLFKVGR